MQDPADEDAADHLRRRAPARLAATPPPLSPSPPPLPSPRGPGATSSPGLRLQASSHAAEEPVAAGGRRSAGSRPGSGLPTRKPRARSSAGWRLLVASLAVAACLVTLMLHPYSRCGNSMRASKMAASLPSAVVQVAAAHAAAAPPQWPTLACSTAPSQSPCRNPSSQAA
jgi:hypothetical protein